MDVETILDADLETASRAIAELVPDVVAALDWLVPRVAVGGDLDAVRRYCSNVESAAVALTSLPARHPDVLPDTNVVLELLRRDTSEMFWVSPSRDGIGVVTVLIDRFRGFTGGRPQECVQLSSDIDTHLFSWFLKAVATVELERESSSPLRRAMTILDLTSSEMADLMGVKRQAVDKWLLASPPVDRAAKIAVISEIADILHHRLRDGLPAAVARRPADAYGGRSMLELIKNDEHEWLHQSVRNSFDYGRVA